jgi:hypothetical protein
MANTQSSRGILSRGELLNAGYAVKARKSAKERWMERASVVLNTPNSRMKGRGDAYHSWKSDQHRATTHTIFPWMPRGWRLRTSPSRTGSTCSGRGGAVPGVMWFPLGRP